MKAVLDGIIFTYSPKIGLATNTHTLFNSSSLQSKAIYNTALDIDSIIIDTLIFLKR